MAFMVNKGQGSRLLRRPVSLQLRESRFLFRSSFWGRARKVRYSTLSDREAFLRDTSGFSVIRLP